MIGSKCEKNIVTVFHGKETAPCTLDDEVVQLTPEERAAVHTHIIQKVKEDRNISHQEPDEFLTLNLQEFVKQKATGINLVSILKFTRATNCI